MSASGTGIFDDDVACDVRTQFRELLAEGKSPAQATRAVLRDWQEALEDEEDGPVIWLALAATQCRHGCLEPRVKARALAVIDDGSDLEHWRATGDSGLVRSRAAVLQRLRARLVTPPVSTWPPARPKPRREPPRLPKSAWPLGEVIAYRLRSGRYILLHVCDHLGSDRVGYAPMCAVCNWRGKRLPPAERIQKLPYKTKQYPFGERQVFMVSIGRASEKDPPPDRVIRAVARRSAPASWKQLVGIHGGCSCSQWGYLDQHLQEWLGWE
jgi:hypothetical protein